MDHCVIPSDGDERLITILSIDGGGMRGVIPAYLLAVLEAELQKVDGEEARIADYFDYIAGTSTGGIMTAILTTPYRNGRPRAASEINKFYRHQGSNIFSDTAELMNKYAKPLMKSFEPLPRGNLLSKVIENSKSWMMKAGVWFLRKAFHPVYDNSPLQQQLREYLGGIQLVDTLTNVVIPTYDMNTLHPLIFSTQQAKKTNSKIKMVDVIMGTTAAPYYFSPHEIEDNGQTHVLVDGGLAANNPTLLAIREATRMIENSGSGDSPDEYKFLVLSLGSGSAKLCGHQVGYGGPLNWIDIRKGFPVLVDVLMRAADDMVDIYTASVLSHYKSLNNFLRIQDNTLDPNQVKLNDASKENIDQLEAIAKNLLTRSISTIDLETGLQFESSDSVLPTNYEAITCFARQLSAERRRRYFYT